jgi:hypothetical protein
MVLNRFKPQSDLPEVVGEADFPATFNLGKSKIRII